MSRIKIYFIEIVDLNDGVHQIKSDGHLLKDIKGQ